MKIPTLILSVSLLSAVATAQSMGLLAGSGGSHVVTTIGDYAALARFGPVTDLDALAAGSTVDPFATVHAAASSPLPMPTNGGGARAATTIRKFTLPNGGEGILLGEHGAVRNANPMHGAAAGTSHDAAGAAMPGFGPHALRVAYPNLSAGTGAVVRVRWFGRASAGANVGTRIDVDGDGVPDFTGIGDGNPTSAAIPVTAGANGVVLRVISDGGAAVPAAGMARYEGTLEIVVVAGSLPTSCTFTSFGPSCGADLDGSVGANLALSLDVSNAPAMAPGVLVSGPQAAMPHMLPFGSCTLLIDAHPSIAMHAFHTDANGAATIALPTPNHALTVSLQAVVLTMGQMTMSASTSNGTELVCQ